MAAKIPAREQFSTSPHVKEGRHQMRSGDSLYINPIVLAGRGEGALTEQWHLKIYRFFMKITYVTNGLNLSGY